MRTDGALGGCLVLVLAVGLVLGLGWAAAERGVERERAEAQQEWARAAQVEARERGATERAREANLHREQMFMLWSASLASNQGLVVALSAALGLVAGVALVRWLSQRVEL